MKHVSVTLLIVFLITPPALSDTREEFDKRLETLSHSIVQVLPIRPPANQAEKDRVRMELHRNLMRINNLLNEGQFAEAETALWNIVHSRGVVIGFEHYVELSGMIHRMKRESEEREVEQRRKAESALIEEIDALVQEIPALTREAQSADELDEMVDSLIELTRQAESMKPYVLMTRTEHELSALINFLTTYQLLLHENRRNRLSERERLWQELLNINRTWGFIAHSSILERMPTTLDDPDKSIADFDDVVPLIRTMADLVQAEPKLVPLREREKLNNNTLNVRRIDDLLKLLTVLDEVNDDNIAAAFDHRLRVTSPLHGAREIFDAILTEIRRTALKRLSATLFADIELDETQMTLTEYIKAVTRTYVEREDWEGLLTVFEYQRMANLVAIPFPESHQNDVKAVRLWLQSMQYYGGGQLDYAIAKLLDILELVGVFGPYQQAQDTLRQWAITYGDEYEEAISRAVEWRLNEKAMGQVLAFMARALNDPHPFMRHQGRWQDLRSIVQEEVAHVLAADSPDADAPGTSPPRHPRPMPPF